MSTSRVVTRDKAFYTRQTLETFLAPPSLELQPDATGSDNPEKEESSCWKTKTTAAAETTRADSASPLRTGSTPLGSGLQWPGSVGVRRGRPGTMFSSWSCSDPTCRGEHTGEVRTSLSPVYMWLFARVCVCVRARDKQTADIYVMLHRCGSWCRWSVSSAPLLPPRKSSRVKAVPVWSFHFSPETSLFNQRSSTTCRRAGISVRHGLFSFYSAHMAFTILLKIDLMKWIKWMRPAGDQYRQAPLLWSMLLLGLTISGLRGIRGNLMWWSKMWCVTEKTRSCCDEETEHFLWSRHKPDYVKERCPLKSHLLILRWRQRWVKRCGMTQPVYP